MLVFALFADLFSNVFLCLVSLSHSLSLHLFIYLVFRFSILLYQDIHMSNHLF